MPNEGSWRFANFYFFYFCAIGIIVPYWSLYLQHLTFTPTEIGQLTAILVITKVAAPTIWGAIIDRSNLARGQSLHILKIATGLSLLCFLALYWPAEPSHFGSMAMVLFVYSIFWNACIPQVEAATLNHLGGERHRYGNIRLWGSVGFIVMVLLLGYLLDHYSPSIILHAGALAFVVVFVSSFLLPGPPANVKSNRAVVPIRQLLNKRVLAVLALCTVLQASHAPFYTFFSIYLESYNYSKFHIGWLWTIGVFFEIGIFWVGYRILRYYRLINLFAFTLLTAALRWWLLAAFPQQPVLIWLAQCLHATTFGLNHAVMMQLIDQFFQGRYQVRGQALYVSVSFGLGGAFGSAISGYYWSQSGGQAVFYFAALMMLLASLVAYFLASRQESLTIA